MKNALRLSIGGFIALMAVFAVAQYIPPGPEVPNRYPAVIDGQSLSTSPCFSWTRPGQSAESYINVGGYSQCSLAVKLERSSGDGTYLGFRCWGLLYGDTTLYQIQGATAAVVDSNTDVKLTYGNLLGYRSIGDNNAGTNNEGFDFPFDINHDYLRCCFESDSTTGDVITVGARVSGKK